MKPLSSTLKSLVRAQEEESFLMSILMLGDNVDKRLTLDVLLRSGFFKLVEFPSFTCKVTVQCALMEK